MPMSPLGVTADARRIPIANAVAFRSLIATYATPAAIQKTAIAPVIRPTKANRSARVGLGRSSCGPWYSIHGIRLNGRRSSIFCDRHSRVDVGFGCGLDFLPALEPDSV